LKQTSDSKERAQVKYMEAIIALVIIIGSLVGLDLAALKWGRHTQTSEWIRSGYDPRYNWNVKQD
jgi:hypothetical protein